MYFIRMNTERNCWLAVGSCHKPAQKALQKFSRMYAGVICVIRLAKLCLSTTVR